MCQVAHDMMVRSYGQRSFKLVMCSDRHQGLRKIVGEKYFKPFGDSTFIFALVFMHKSQKDRFHVKI
jgi:hypothetical protein